MTPGFQIDEQDRFNRMQLIPWWEQAKLASARVLVVGAGAIGNEVLKNLALLGVGKLTIVDLDRIETTNLTRSVLFRSKDCGRPKADVAREAVIDLYPTIECRAISGDVLFDVGLDAFAQADLVLGCVDNREARLWVNRCCRRVGTPWIDAGIQEIHGVVQAFRSVSGACYECGLKDLDYRLMSARYHCDGLPSGGFQLGQIPTSPTIASIIAGIQSQWAVKALHQLEIPWGKAWIFNGVTDQTYLTQLPEREDCLSHESWTLHMATPRAARDQTAREWIRDTEKSLQVSIQRLSLERPLTLSGICQACLEKRTFDNPVAKLKAEHRRCPKCQSLMTLESISEIPIDSPLLDLSLEVLGIPTEDWVRLATDQGVRVVKG